MHQKAKPMLFNQSMVLALLAGNKTVSRRPMKWQPHDEAQVVVEAFHPCVVSRSGEIKPGKLSFGAHWDQGERGTPSVFGAPGDWLYVRETWAAWGRDDQCGEGTARVHEPIYRADGYPWDERDKWRPSLHMPKSASRIWLEVTDVRVERVQDITEEEAAAEGMAQVVRENPHLQGKTMREVFQLTWDELYGGTEFAWKENPYVWAGAFKVLTKTGVTPAMRGEAEAIAA